MGAQEARALAVAAAQAWNETESSFQVLEQELQKRHVAVQLHRQREERAKQQQQTAAAKAEVTGTDGAMEQLQRAELEVEKETAALNKVVLEEREAATEVQKASQLLAQQKKESSRLAANAENLEKDLLA